VQNDPVDHTQQIPPFLAIGLAVIDPLDSKLIGECARGRVESDAVIAKILGCFFIPPFEMIILNNIRDSRSFCNCLV